MVKATLLVATLPLLVSVGAGAARQSTLPLTLAGTPANLAATPGCPGGRTSLPIVARGGRRIGSSLVCVGEARKTERPGFAVGTILEKVVETDVLRAGSIRSRATYTFRFVRPDGSLARVTIRGSVVGGTGRYAGARGSTRGAGYATSQGDLYRQRIKIAIELR